MTREEQKAKVLAAIAARGWSLVGVFVDAARELKDEGKVKMSDRYFTGGNKKLVWISA